MALSAVEARVITALGQLMFPREKTFPVDGRDARLTDWVEDYLDRMPALQRGQFKALLHTFNVGFGLTRMRPGATFVSASPEEQLAWIEAWEGSAVYQRRMAWDGLRTVLTMGYAESDAVRAQLGLKSGLETARERLREDADGNTREAS